MDRGIKEIYSVYLNILIEVSNPLAFALPITQRIHNTFIHV